MRGIGKKRECASVNGYLLSIIESKELAKVSAFYGEAGRKERGHRARSKEQGAQAELKIKS